jgi:hypothetical protein
MGKDMMRNRFLCFVAIVGACVFLNAAQAHAAWWEFKDIPVPPGAKEFKKATQDIDGKKVEFTHYTSSSSIEEIKEFYRKNLTFRGWKERDVLEDAKAVPELAQSVALKEMMGYNLVFEKGDENVLINIVPPGYLPGGKTRFSISRGKLELNLDVPDFKKSPTKKENIPLYPGVSGVSYIETQGALVAAYGTEAELEKIASFYKQTMDKLGWDLVSESPAEKVDFSGFKCESCEKNYGMSKKDMEARSVALRQLALEFKGKKAESLRIDIWALDFPEKIKEIQNLTRVAVTYEEKK